MKLSDLRILFFDLQTTGMRPPAGRVLEAGWCESQPGSSGEPTSQVFSLPSELSIPKKVTEITSLTDKDLLGKPDAESWFANDFAKILHSNVDALVIHYAQFERPYLNHFSIAPPPVICTQSLTSRLMPDLPSRNLRAVAGYFGFPVTGPNRAAVFAEATRAIWLGLQDALTAEGLHELEHLLDWLKAKPIKSTKTKSLKYRIESSLRLGLPDQPGIYRMKAKSGQILYVGKATSLKDRVNSYFRGVKNRDRRKLEMLAQVWDLEVEECRTPLEAALRECDEIKRWDPPYNVVLKKGGRDLVFYSRAFDALKSQESVDLKYGPFRPGGWMEMILNLWEQLKNPLIENIFYLPIDHEILNAGFEMFLKQERVSRASYRSPRDLVAHALKLYRQRGEPEARPVAHEDQDQIETEANPEEIAGKFERLFRRAGGAFVRAKKLKAASNCKVEYRHKGAWLRLEFAHGHLKSQSLPNFEEKILPPSIWNIDTYDRLSILLSELSRVDHRILRHP